MKQYNVPFPRGSLASTVEEAVAIASEISKPVVLKSQILTSGRSKAGGILFASGENEVRSIARKLLGSTIKGNIVTHVLVEEKVDVVEEWYASVTIDRQSKTYVLLASTSGGIDIEELAGSSPEKIKRHLVDFSLGFGECEAAELVKQFSIDTQHVSLFAAILYKLYRVAMDYDAELVEINPTARVSSGDFLATDARIILDDNALFRHPEYKGDHVVRTEDTPQEFLARQQGLEITEVDGIHLHDFSWL